MKIMFWNTHHNKAVNEVLCALIIENDVSVVALAEYEGDTCELINRLDLMGIRFRAFFSAGCDRITVFGSIKNVDAGPQSSHYTIQIINNNDIMCCAHLPSKAYADHEARREIIIGKLLNDISCLEAELKTEHTMIVGDFNINPFEDACVGARYLHGIPYYAETVKKKRKVAGTDFYMFYNPMWNFLGDFQSPFGTYYYNKGSSATFWNIYDQVIIRPELRERFVDESLKILTKTKELSLVDSDGHPIVSISDHLPIIFEIKEE